MVVKILTEIEYLSSDYLSNFDLIESALNQKYGDVVRWAVIASDKHKITVSVSYKTRN